MKNPKIRFKGCTEDWEQRKLNEIAEKVTEKNKNNLYDEPFTNSAEQGIISQKDYFDREVVNEENLDGYYVVREDDFVYNPRVSVSAPVGPINRNKLGRNGVMSPLYTVFRTHDINTTYLEHYFKTKCWHLFMKMNGDSGARFDRFSIATSLFMEMPIPYPEMDEQAKIGGYFDELDKLITLHQRKCEETKKLKKYMLQKMFPKDGATVPEIRFAGFTEAWEQRKVSDVAEIIAGGTPSTKENSYWEPKEIPWLSSGEVHKKYITFTDDMISQIGMNNSSAKMVAKDSVLIALAGQGKTRGTVAINRIPLTTNQSIAAMTFNEDFIPEFVFYNLENRYDEIRRMSSGDGSRGGLNKQLVGDIEIPYTEKEEQERIGSFFEALDHLITLHQRKSDELQNIKKYMLQNMFV